MLECKVEIAEDDTGSDMARGPQMSEAVQVKVEPPEESVEDDTVDESQMFEAVEMKVEPPEDYTVRQPQVQAPASATKGANSTKTGDGGAARMSRGAPIHRQARKIILNVAQCCEVEKQTKQLLFPLREPLARAAEYVGRSVESLRELQRTGDAGTDVDGPTPGKQRLVHHTANGCLAWMKN